MAWLDHNGIRLHWREDGPAGAAAILFLNSLGTDFRLWDKVLPAFATAHRCIRLDTRGHGQSDAPETDYDIEMLKGDALALLDHLGLEKVTLIGVSLGGMIAQSIASSEPKRVVSAVFSNTAARMGAPDLWAERIQAVRAGGMETMADAILDRWFPAPYRNGPEIDHWRSMLIATPVAGYVGCCAALAAADLTENTSKIDCSALVIGGSSDGSSPPDVVRGFSNRLTRAEYHEIEGSGHLPMADAPTRFVALVEKFLERVAP
ncbi:MAG: 3-oxoadipate enol-lactonase [Pseudomonadota bacterium]